jgi:hypothetical protein
MDTERLIAFVALNVIRKRVITKVLVEYTKVHYSSIRSRLGFTTLMMERYSLGPLSVMMFVIVWSDT